MTVESELITLTGTVTTAVGLLTTQRSSVQTDIDAGVLAAEIPFVQMATAQANTWTSLTNYINGV